MIRMAISYWDFVKALAFTNPFEAELKTVRKGIQLAIRHGYKRQLIETDTMQEIQCITIHLSLIILFVTAGPRCAAWRRGNFDMHSGNRTKQLTSWPEKEWSTVVLRIQIFLSILYCLYKT